MSKNAHQTQLPATPFVLTISVTRFGVSAEKVVATIEIPSSHHGIFLPDKKNSVTSLPDFFETKTPIKSDMTKKPEIITQSMFSSCMLKVYLSVKFVRLIRSSKYIIILFFSIIFIGIGNAQDNSTGNMDIPFTPMDTESNRSLLNQENNENPYLKKFQENDKKDFFPDANVEEKNPERFINSNEFYLSRLNKKEAESNKNINRFKVDQFLGEIRNDGEYVNIILRDHEYPDGDLIKVEVNEQIVMAAILLTEKAKGFKLDLKSGFNVVDFVALNQGSSGPNTAEIIVYDDQGKLVGTNRWNLATGVKATYIIYKN